MICILHNRKGRFGRRVGQQVKVIQEFDLSNHDPGKIAVINLRDWYYSRKPQPHIQENFKYLENLCKTCKEVICKCLDSGNLSLLLNTAWLCNKQVLAGELLVLCAYGEICRHNLNLNLFKTQDQDIVNEMSLHISEIWDVNSFSDAL